VAAADLLVRARRAVLPDAECPASVLVEAGRIVEVGPYGRVADAAEIVELGDDAGLPPALRPILLER
jgi:dihydroorotase-like cyclic amidohydrolase